MNDFQLTISKCKRVTRVLFLETGLAFSEWQMVSEKVVPINVSWHVLRQCDT